MEDEVVWRQARQENQFSNKVGEMAISDAGGRKRGGKIGRWSQGKFFLELVNFDETPHHMSRWRQTVMTTVCGDSDEDDGSIKRVVEVFGVQGGKKADFNIDRVGFGDSRVRFSTHF